MNLNSGLGSGTWRDVSRGLDLRSGSWLGLESSWVRLAVVSGGVSERSMTRVNGF